MSQHSSLESNGKGTSMEQLFNNLPDLVDTSKSPACADKHFGLNFEQMTVVKCVGSDVMTNLAH